MSERRQERTQRRLCFFYFGKKLGWHIFSLAGEEYFFPSVSLAIFPPSPLLLRTERSEGSACRLNKDCRAVLTALWNRSAKIAHFTEAFSQIPFTKFGKRSTEPRWKSFVIQGDPQFEGDVAWAFLSPATVIDVVLHCFVVSPFLCHSHLYYFLTPSLARCTSTQTCAHLVDKSAFPPIHFILEKLSGTYICIWPTKSRFYRPLSQLHSCRVNATFRWN